MAIYNWRRSHKAPTLIPGALSENIIVTRYYDKLAKQTADLVPNPHHSHLGQVNCEDCHKANLSKPVLICNQCHNFTIRKDGKPIELAK